MNVYAIFSENAGQWSERGTLRRECRCGRVDCELHACPSPQFVLDVAADLGGGTRVFPLIGRTAEVYRTGEHVPCVQTGDDEILIDNFYPTNPTGETP